MDENPLPKGVMLELTQLELNKRVKISLVDKINNCELDAEYYPTKFPLISRKVRDLVSEYKYILKQNGVY